MICTERGKHRFKPNMREIVLGYSKQNYSKCLDCGFEKDSKEIKKEEKDIK